MDFSKSSKWTKTMFRSVLYPLFPNPSDRMHPPQPDPTPMPLAATVLSSIETRRHRNLSFRERRKNPHLRFEVEVHKMRKRKSSAKSNHNCGKPTRRAKSKLRFCKRRAAKVIFSSRKGWIGLCDQHATELRRLFPAAAGAIMTILP